MKPNTLKAKWQAGQVTLGAWLGIPNWYTAELVARQGYDYVCVDTQHGLIEYSDAVPMIRGIHAQDALPIVRVPWNEPGIIMKMLDAGAMGVIVPMVNTAEEARRAVAACRYYPAGMRSNGPQLAGMIHGPDYFANANNEVLCIPMVETKEAVENLDEILAVPGIDAIYVGPSDLAITYGYPPALEAPGAWEEARIKIANSCNARGVIAGMHANAALAAKHAAAGYKMITITPDGAALQAGCQADLAVAGKGVQGARSNSPY